MTTVYVAQQNATVIRRAGRLAVVRQDETLFDLPETSLEQLVLMGNVQLTTPVINYCLQNNIKVAFVSMGGKYRGCLQGEGTKTASLRQQQYARSLEAPFCLRQAQAFVRGKTANQLALMRRHQAQPLTQQQMQRMNYLLPRLAQTSEVASLLGLEGSLAAAYFAAFAEWLPPRWEFPQRLSHPSPDPVNALLSFGYTLLYHRVSTHLHLLGLDVYLGFLHQPRHSHAALASDLMEEFRPVIVDSLVLRLLRKRMLTPADFAPDEEHSGGVRLQRPALQRFLQNFEERWQTRVQYPAAGGKRFTYGLIVEAQARHLARVIQGADELYRPFTMK